MAHNTYPNLADRYPYRICSVDSDGPISINQRDDWWWYLDLRGQPLYLISNSCGTCEAIFKRERDLKTSLAPRALSQQLEQGLETISENILDTVLPLLPKGNYIVGLLELKPVHLTTAEHPNGVGCEADEFWWRLFERAEDHCSYELILPSVPEQALNAARVADYRRQLNQGQKPTALALSMTDERHPHGGPYTESALVHFVLDGHHKIMAASQTGQPITLLSFFRESWFTGQPYVDNWARDYYERMANMLRGR